jgi:hypothetical protein
MGRQHRHFVETPTDRLRDAMDVLEVIAARPCDNQESNEVAVTGRDCDELQAVARCATCRARDLVEREDKITSSLRDVRRERARAARS